MTRWLELLWERPARLVTVSFAAVALLGAALLMLPSATTGSGGLDPVDALFTATSAVCVTGLIVVDTATAFTGFGQTVILALIQIGGLGIMAFAVSTVYLVRRRLTMDEAELLSFMLNEQNRSMVARQLRGVILTTLAIEAVGALLLTGAFFRAGFAGDRAVWLGVFHAVSAFCNAGFALFSDSLESFVRDPIVNGTVMVLILAGGLGFATLSVLRGRREPGSEESSGGTPMVYQPVLQAAREHRRLRERLRAPDSVAARVTVIGTVVLVVLGAVAFYSLEARRSLIGLPLPEKYLASLFQSVTLRTAGFNTVSMAALHRTTLLVTIPFMLIGGASGGTAGGIKIGTVAVIIAEIRRFFLRDRDATLFRRRLAGRLVTQAVVVTISGVVLVFVATIVLSFTEEAALEAILFEVVSAIGTVGLSTGLTGDLSTTGRLVIVVLMFVGRLGPLTLLAAFRPEGHQPVVRRPEVEIPIG